MVNTNDFKTKTFRLERVNPNISGKWGVAIDIGYSGTKVISPNIVMSFPSVARKVENGTVESALGGVDETFIAYKDETGEYLVGEAAQGQISSNDADGHSASAYVRTRYFSQDFRVVSRVGLALGMLNNAYGFKGDNELYVVTGLPIEYMNDKGDLIEALTGHHDFWLKDGKKNWIHYIFDLDKNHILVMPQPMGTLISVSSDKEGNTTKLGENIFSKNSLVFDAGFGTLDIYEIRNGLPHSAKTWSNFGMLRVLQEASRLIKENHDKEIPVSAMQRVLEDGNFMAAIPKGITANFDKTFEPIIESFDKNFVQPAIEEYSKKMAEENNVQPNQSSTQSSSSDFDISSIYESGIASSSNGFSSSSSTFGF